MSSTELATRQAGGLAIHGGQTVLGEKPVRIPTCGTIRPGIKVLTPAAAKNAKAVQIYERGIAVGARYSDIEAEIKKACNFEKSPLMPKNVQWFSARRGDFDVPEIADRIMGLYGQEGEDGVRRLYRFPITFPVDAWQAVLPHSLQVFTRSERVYWSEYTPSGVRMCMMHAPPVIDQKAKRAVRTYGGRRAVPRPENNGVCDPEKCKEYQADLCRLSGQLIFYIPQVPGSGAVALPMTSFYGMQGIRQQLELMAYARGRISGLQDGKPLFYLTKQLEEVSMINRETGKAERKAHWIVKLEADVEMAKLLDAPDPPRAAVAAAVAALEGSAADNEEEEGGNIIEHESVDQGAVEEREEATGAEQSAPGQAGDMSAQEQRNQIAAKVAAFGLSLNQQFKPYAIEKWGEKWSVDPAKLSLVLDELNAVAEDGKDDYVKQVTEGVF